MPEWLSSTGDSAGPLLDGWDEATSMAVQLGLAFLCGCVIALIYRLARPKGQVVPSFPATLMLLCILCAMLPMVIGENVAWAFGLVGALSIVRFRTAVDDTHDITFVIFAVLVGMAVGANRLPVAVVGIGVTGAAALLVRPPASGAKSPVRNPLDRRLRIRIGIGRDPKQAFAPVFSELLSEHELVSGATSKQGASLDLIYRVRLVEGASPADLLNRLNLLDGVRSVELRR